MPSNQKLSLDYKKLIDEIQENSSIQIILKKKKMKHIKFIERIDS